MKNITLTEKFGFIKMEFRKEFKSELMNNLAKIPKDKVGYIEAFRVLLKNCNNIELFELFVERIIDEIGKYGLREVPITSALYQFFESCFKILYGVDKV